MNNNKLDITLTRLQEDTTFLTEISVTKQQPTTTTTPRKMNRIYFPNRRNKENVAPKSNIHSSNISVFHWNHSRKSP
jgi:hypothetical protein